jgi:predicted nucleic acid-binding protein
LTDLPVVADAGPLIGLARVGLLDLLRHLYGKILIPVQVFEELQTSEGRPGSRALRAALQEGCSNRLPSPAARNWNL